MLLIYLYRLFLFDGCVKRFRVRQLLPVFYRNPELLRKSDCDRPSREKKRKPKNVSCVIPSTLGFKG